MLTPRSPGEGCLTPRRDRGAVLPLALVITVVLGALVVSIASYAATALRSTSVTLNRVERKADAEAGMRDALISLDRNAACPALDDAVGPNGSVIAVESCDVVEVETADTTRRFGLVMTGLHGQQIALDGKNNSKEPVEIGGDVYLGPQVSGTPDFDELIALNDVIVARDSCDNYEPDELTFMGALPGPAKAKPLCRTWPWHQVSPPPSGLTIPSTPGGFSTSNGCRVYRPGFYTNTINTGNNASVYFESGVYLITSRVQIRNGTHVTAGHPFGIQSIFPGDTNQACRPAQLADINDTNGGGSGVVFVFAGDGRFDFGNNTNTEVFGFPVGDRILSVIAFPTDGSGAVPPELVPSEFAGNSHRSTRSITQNLMDGNPNGYVTFRGEFWAPASWVALHVPSSGKAGAGFLGGVTVARTNYHLTGNAEGGLLFMVDTGPRQYRYRLVVTATDDRGTTTSVTAVAVALDDGLVVESWRVS